MVSRGGYGVRGIGWVEALISKIWFWEAWLISINKAKKRKAIMTTGNNNL